MIWAERYLEAGEFELRTPRIDYTMGLLPLDSFISLRDSQEVMMVEDHEIETNDQGIDILKMTGRTFEAPVLESRMLGMGGYNTAFRTQPANAGTPSAGDPSIGYTPMEAAAAVTWDMILNTTNWSVLRPTYGNDPKTVIPNVAISLTQHADANNVYWWLENGQAYPIVLDFLTRGGAGVRNIRPPWLAEFPPTEYMGVLANGDISRTQNTSAHQNKLTIDFYKGLDRSEGQVDRPSVSFDWYRKDLKRARYLFSNKNMRNVAEVHSSVGSVYVYENDTVTPFLSGLKRRILYVDGGNPGTGVTQEQFISGLVQKGEIELAKHNRIAAMEAAIQATTKAKYGVDYFLGDAVTLRGNYGFSQKMRVAEYVRTSDGFVDEGYPSLIITS